MLTYDPVADQRTISSRRYTFSAPIGPIELHDIRWYIESYYRWPTGVFKERAHKLEQTLPTWGHALYCASSGTAFG